MLKKVAAEMKKLVQDISDRDEALREWEQFWQAESNSREANASNRNKQQSSKPDGKKGNEDLLASADADFDAPLVSF